jgi:quercetin dioxygenase-like cupin family protein
MKSVLNLIIILIVLTAPFSADAFLSSSNIYCKIGLTESLKRNLTLGELRAVAERVGVEHKAEIIEALNKTEPFEGRVYFKVFEDNNMTVWAIKWLRKRTKIHDHVTSQAGIYVVQGRIFERYYNRIKSKFFSRLRIFNAGDSVALPASHIHEVEGDDDAITIHVYSSRLEKMTYYELDSRGNPIAISIWHDDKP